jgi:hypothetical protein
MYECLWLEGTNGIFPGSGGQAMHDIGVKHEGIIVPGEMYSHDVICGRVDCSLCGARVFSRNTTAIRVWKVAHAKCCKQRPKSERLYIEEQAIAD